MSLLINHTFEVSFSCPNKNKECMSCLYVGLGGFGIDAAKTVFERNQLNKKGCSKDKFLLIDTDVHQRGNFPEELRRAFIAIGEKAPDFIKEEVMNSPQKEWFISWYDWYDRNSSLHEATETVRPYGRIALLSKYDEMYNHLTSVLCELEQGLDTDELLHVIVFTGSCGGTGSAITLDILYMIRTIMMSGVIRDLEKCNNICLFVAMPQLWISMAGKNYDHYDPSLEYKLTANSIAFFTELQSAINSSDVTPSSYSPLVPPAEWMKDYPFYPFSCCCVFESNRMTKSQVCNNMAEVACALRRVVDSDIYWGMANSMSVVSYHHLQEESLSVVTLRRCSEIVDIDLSVDRIKRKKVCYLVRPDFKIPIEVLNLGNENIIEIEAKEQTGVDVLSFHNFSFKDYAFYKQYRARSDGRYAYVDKRFAQKIVNSGLESLVVC